MRTSAVLAILVLTSLAGASTATADAPAEPTTLGQALVGFHASAWPGLAAGDGLRGLEVVDVIPQIAVAVVAADDLGAVRSALAGLPGLAYVEDDHLLTASVVPDDPRYGDQYGPGMMGFPTAWGKVGYGSSDVTVAVLDTGIRRTHEDLAGRVLTGRDYVNDDNDPNDDCGHGTHVAGTVGATTDNGRGVAGMSQATILPMKVLSPLGLAFVTCSGSASDIAAAIVDSTDQGADIISMSLGGGGSNTEKNAVDYAWNNGVLVLAASGNDGGSNSVDCPACYDSVVAVAALDATGNRASYSDAGPQVEIAAPGSNVWSTYNGNNADYRSLSGTSMATPHVAGALALALSCDPSLTNVQLRNLMQSTAQDKGAAGRDTVYGYGLLRVDSLVAGLSCGGGGGGNNAPTAGFSASVSGLSVSVDGGASSDPDGDSLSYGWSFGDGATATGATASHTYAAAGTYTVTLTVSDGNGGSDSTSKSVSVSVGGGGCGTDPEPGVAEMADGSSETFTVPSGGWTYRKVCVPGDASQVTVGISSAESCGLLGCSSDADLYARRDAKPTTSAYDCRPYASGSNEQCTVPAAGQWVLVGVHGYTGSPTVTLTVDHDGTGTAPTNNAPTASATGSCTDLACGFSGAGSSDPDGDALSYSWTFGDGATGTGPTPGHTYAAAGTYTATLTVSDGNGGSDTDSVTVTVTAPAAGCGSDPDPGAATMASGTTYGSSMSAGDWVHRKVCVPAGKTVQVDMTGPSCGVLSCSIDADLYVREGARPDANTWDCRPYLTGSAESCTLTASSTAWHFVGVNAYSGSGTIQVTATVS